MATVPEEVGGGAIDGFADATAKRIVLVAGGGAAIAVLNQPVVFVVAIGFAITAALQVAIGIKTVGDGAILANPVVAVVVVLVEVGPACRWSSVTPTMLPL